MMKKRMISVFLCLTIIFQFSSVSFATTRDAAREELNLSLTLSADAESEEMMQNSGLEKFGIEKMTAVDTRKASSTNEKPQAQTFSLSNKTTLNVIFSKLENTDNGLIASGEFILTINNEPQVYTFRDSFIEEYTLRDGDKMYVGILSSYVEKSDERIPVLVDFASTLNFENYRASISVGTIEDNAGILFFGESFPHYSEYVLETLHAHEEGKIISSNQSELLLANSIDVPESDWYEHAGYAVNRKMGSNTGTVESVIVTAAKRDFSDTGNNRGFELIRIFARDINARNLVDGATSAVPVKAVATFQSNTTGFLDIDAAYPNSSSIQMPACFAIFSNIHAGIGAALAIVEAGLNAVLSNVSQSMSVASGGGYDEIEVTMSINSATSSYASLPHGTAIIEAIEDEAHGIACKVVYDHFDSPASSGQVTVKGSVQYRIYNGSHNTSVVSSGAATVSHYIWA
jgi:hypothetical protein